MTLFDAGTLDDPVVRRLHVLGEIVVGHHARRHVHADAHDPAAMHHRGCYHAQPREIERVRPPRGDSPRYSRDHERAARPTRRDAVEPRRPLSRPHRYAALGRRRGAGAATRPAARRRDDRASRSRRRCRAQGDRASDRRRSRRRSSSTTACSRSRTARGKASSRATSSASHAEMFGVWRTAPGRDAPAGPGAETLGDVEARAWPVLARTVRAARPATRPGLIVAHDAVNRVLVCRVLGLPLERVWTFRQSPAALNVLAGDSLDDAAGRAAQRLRAQRAAARRTGASRAMRSLKARHRREVLRT